MNEQTAAQNSQQDFFFLVFRTKIHKNFSLIPIKKKLHNFHLSFKLNFPMLCIVFLLFCFGFFCRTKHTTKLVLTLQSMHWSTEPSTYWILDLLPHDSLRAHCCLISFSKKLIVTLQVVYFSYAIIIWSNAQLFIWISIMLKFSNTFNATMHKAQKNTLWTCVWYWFDAENKSQLHRTWKTATKKWRTCEESKTNL